jgi:histidinol-phosphatase (PHP family)
MRTDYHLHTPLCGHATGAPRDFDDWRMAPDELGRYVALVEEARREFPRYPVRLGLECDFIPGYEGHIRALAGQAGWDYLIGSVHYVTPDWDIDNPKHLKRWKEQPVDEIWRSYFAAYTKMIQSCLFDFLAHPDLVKKFGHRPEGDLSRFYKDTLDAAAEAGAVLEVSTAGLRKDAKEIYPSREFLDAAFHRRIPIVINSDAHAPEEVAHEFDRAYKLVSDIGYTEVMRFEQRRAIPVKIS